MPLMPASFHITAKLLITQWFYRKQTIFTFKLNIAYKFPCNTVKQKYWKEKCSKGNYRKYYWYMINTIYKYRSRVIRYYKDIKQCKSQRYHPYHFPYTLIMKLFDKPPYPAWNEKTVYNTYCRFTRKTYKRGLCKTNLICIADLCLSIKYQWQHNANCCHKCRCKKYKRCFSKG